MDSFVPKKKKNSKHKQKKRKVDVKNEDDHELRFDINVPPPPPSVSEEHLITSILENGTSSSEDDYPRLVSSRSKKRPRFSEGDEFSISKNKTNQDSYPSTFPSLSEAKSQISTSKKIKSEKLRAILANIVQSEPLFGRIKELAQDISNQYSSGPSDYDLKELLHDSAFVATGIIAREYMKYMIEPVPLENSHSEPPSSNILDSLPSHTTATTPAGNTSSDNINSQAEREIIQDSSINSDQLTGMQQHTPEERTPS